MRNGRHSGHRTLAGVRTEHGEPGQSKRTRDRMSPIRRDVPGGAAPLSKRSVQGDRRQCRDKPDLLIGTARRGVARIAAGADLDRLDALVPHALKGETVEVGADPLTGVVGVDRVEADLPELGLGFHGVADEADDLALSPFAQDRC